MNLTGTLDNTGSTLALDSRTGGWNVFGGTIIGGTITTSGGNVLTAVNSSNTMSGVTLDGTLDMASVFAPKMNVTSGLTLNGTILLGGASGSERRHADGAGHAGVVGHRQYPLRRLGHHVPGHFQRRDADPRRGPDPARPERRDQRHLHQSGDHQRRPGRPDGRQHCGRGLDPHRHRLDQSGHVAGR